MEGPSLFVVDDDAAVRKALRRVLLALNRPVRLFASAEAFLEQVGGDARGCLILDVRLPGITGLQLQEHLAGSGSKLRILFITAHDDPDAREHALRRGAIAYLRKPFDRTKLIEGVRAALEQREAAPLGNDGNDGTGDSGDSGDGGDRVDDDDGDDGDDAAEPGAAGSAAPL
jgi:FixJ family two-component response regulator